MTQIVYRMRRSSRNFLPVLGVILTLGSGCTPEPSTPDDARSILEATLQAWADGQAAQNLEGAASRVRVGDPKWEAGFQLIRFQVSEGSEAVGLDQQFQVELWMKSPEGEPAQETARFLVSTNPAQTVIRAPF